MKIEDITPQKEKKNYYVKNNWFNYWFPLPKGCLLYTSDAADEL